MTESKASVPLVTIRFTDGHTEDVRISPKTMVLAERHFKGQLPPLESTWWSVWHQLGRPDRFDDWLDTVESMSTEDEAVDPTEPARGDGS